MTSDDLAALAVVINAIGTDNLGAAIDAALRPKLSFDMSCAYLFRFNRNAIMVHGGTTSQFQKRRLAPIYAAVTYSILSMSPASTTIPQVYGA